MAADKKSIFKDEINQKDIDQEILASQQIDGVAGGAQSRPARPAAEEESRIPARKSAEDECRLAMIGDSPVESSSAIWNSDSASEANKR